MAPSKLYKTPDYYEAKLSRVMERLLSGQDYSYNFDRFGAWVEFVYHGDTYRFEHSVKRARSRGQDIHYGSDAFAQLVLALEDLSRIVDRGIYDLSSWVSAFRFLPPPAELPQCFAFLGFTEVPATVADINARYRLLSKVHHPDTGGDPVAFRKLQEAADEARRLVGGESEEGSDL